jgi:hypothetical protein
MKAYQRIIREKSSKIPKLSYFFDNNASFPIADIKKAVLKEISYKEAERIILKYEWLGTMGTTQYHYGIEFENELAGAICFGYFQAMQGYETYVGIKYKDKGIQLTRGACVHWAHEHSGSKLIAYGLKKMSERGYKFVIAFSDPEAGEIGTLYQATNWYYLGATNVVHWDLYYKDGQNARKCWMNDRDFFKKYGFCGKQKLEEFVKNRPELEIRIRRPKGRYIKLIGNRKENKEMLSVFSDKIQPYPKRSHALSL